MILLSYLLGMWHLPEFSRVFFIQILREKADSKMRKTNFSLKLLVKVIRNWKNSAFAVLTHFEWNTGEKNCHLFICHWCENLGKCTNTQIYRNRLFVHIRFMYYKCIWNMGEKNTRLCVCACVQTEMKRDKSTSWFGDWAIHVTPTTKSEQETQQFDGKPIFGI